MMPLALPLQVGASAPGCRLGAVGAHWQRRAGSMPGAPWQPPPPSPSPGPPRPCTPCTALHANVQPSVARSSRSQSGGSAPFHARVHEAATLGSSKRTGGGGKDGVHFAVTLGNGVHWPRIGSGSSITSSQGRLPAEVSGVRFGSGLCALPSLRNPALDFAKLSAYTFVPCAYGCFGSRRIGKRRLRSARWACAGENSAVEDLGGKEGIAARTQCR